MRVNFSIKLFVTFLFTGLVIFLSTLFIEYKMIKTKLEEKNKSEFLADIEKIDSKIKQNELFARKTIETIFNSKIIKNKNPQQISEFLQALVYTNKIFLEVSILDKDFKVLYNQQKNKTNTKRDIDLLWLSKIEKNKLISKGIDLSTKKQEIETPLVSLCQFAKKDENKSIVIYVAYENIFKQLKNIKYILDEKENILYDNKGIFSWSKYYYPSENLSSKILKGNNKLKEELTLNNKKLTLIGSFEELKFISFLKSNTKELAYISSLTFFISLLLSFIFTLRVSKVNNKLLAENDILSNSIQKEKSTLSDSLEIIDQNIMYLKMDKNYYIEDISSYFCLVYGYEKEELIGQHYSILYSQEKYQSIKKDILLNLKTKKEWKGEILTKRKSGEEYWVESHIRADYKDDEVVSYTIVRKDISDNKKVEKLYADLNYQIEQLNVVFQNVTSGIALIDFKGNFNKTNVAFREILNYKNNELLSSNILSLVEPRSRHFLENVLEQVLSFGSVSNMELIFTRKNSEDIYLDLSMKILPDKENIVVVVNSLEDKRKLQELNQNLEERVKTEVRKNIEKDKIHQEEKLKNVKLTSIGTLAAGITHEINTPLTYLKGNFEMLQMDIDDVEDENLKNEMNESCTKITDAINRISVIVESMREMSQKSSEVQEKTNIFSTLVTSLTMAYNVSKQISKVYLNNKEFKLTNIQKDDFEYFAYIQKQRLEQVWIIIINNALDELKKIDSYDNRELKIDIFEEGNHLVISFSDNAGGISENILPNIFEPFVSSKEHSGMGVGLNIAKKIIDEQNGEIKAYNSSNGAVFEIRLKLVK